MASAIQTNPTMLEAKVGRVTTPILVENLRDVLDLRDGKLTDDCVRRVTVEKAIVDTGVATLSLPSGLVQQLGLIQLKTKRVMTSRGLADCNVYSAVRLTIQDRDCSVDVFEVPDGVPVLVGQIPLELMDFVVDPGNQRLMGNPEHHGEWILDLL